MVGVSVIVVYSFSNQVRALGEIDQWERLDDRG